MSETSMKVVCLIVLFLSKLLGESAVVSLTSTNYQQVLNKGKVLVKYFSPNFGECKALAPTYERVAAKFNVRYGDKVTVAEVDCVANNEICNAAGVHTFPTIRFYKSGKSDFDEYDGDRSLENFQQFLSSQIGAFYKPPIYKAIILTPENFNSIVFDPKLNVLVAFTASWFETCFVSALCERTASGLINFMNSRAGTFRLAGGSIQYFAGLKTALVTPVKELTTLLRAGGSEQAIAAQKRIVLEAVASTVKNEYVSSQYIRYVNKIVEQGVAGVAFAKAESARMATLK